MTGSVSRRGGSVSRRGAKTLPVSLDMPIAVTKDRLPDYLENINLNKSVDVHLLADGFQWFFEGRLHMLDARKRKMLRNCGLMLLTVLDSEESPDPEAIDRAAAEITRLWKEWGDELC